jgi:hypothetical protein
VVSALRQGVSMARIDDSDVTTIMAMLGDIREDVNSIKRLLEDDDGEEEASEDDA